MFKKNCNHMQPDMCCCEREPMMNMGCPIIEPTITNCVEKKFCHEVEHIVPMHTHVVNKHIINHSYRPEFTCSEENVVIDNNCCGAPNNFMGRN